VGTLCSGSGRHCHHPLRRQLPLIIVCEFRSNLICNRGKMYNKKFDRIYPGVTCRYAAVSGMLRDTPF
jgi:hypothetical protein